MIEVLKSELKLRPTYDEMIGIINQQGDENRPSIENVIDRRASLFRNNQFGSQFDKVDFLGLKKQEENKVKNELRNAQLKETASKTGASMSVLSYDDEVPAYIDDGFETPTSDGVSLANIELMSRVKEELKQYQDKQQYIKGIVSSIIEDALEQSHRQSMPEGVPIHSMATDDEMPPLVPIEQEVEEEEEFEDDPVIEEADENETTKAPGVPRKHKETIDYNESIDRWKQKDVSVDDILYQLHLRGIELTEEQNEEMANLKTKGKGKTITKKDYLINFVERLIQTGKWTDEINDELLRKRMEEWRALRKGKGKGIIRRAFDSAGSAVLDAGKEIVKDVVVEGAKSAVMSLL